MFSLFRNRKMSVKIGLGYLAVGVVLVGAVSATLWQVKRTAAVTDRVIDLRTPTVQSSLMMLNGMNHSLAALRGWMILGKEKFKDERSKAWSEEIEPSLAKMKTYSLNWTDPENVKRLAVIEKSIGNFKRFQQEIEDISQTVDNTRATKILLVEAAPLADILAGEITRMIDLEFEEEPISRYADASWLWSDTTTTSRD